MGCILSTFSTRTILRSPLIIGRPYISRKITKNSVIDDTLPTYAMLKQAISVGCTQAGYNFAYIHNLKLNGTYLAYLNYTS